MIVKDQGKLLLALQNKRKEISKHQSCGSWSIERFVHKTSTKYNAWRGCVCNIHTGPKSPLENFPW